LFINQSHIFSSSYNHSLFDVQMRSAAIVGESSITGLVGIHDLDSKVQFILFSNGNKACFGEFNNTAITCDVGDNKWYVQQSANLVSLVGEPPNSSLSHHAATGIRIAIMCIHVPQVPHLLQHHPYLMRLHLHRRHHRQPKLLSL
jgi:hypothetical protein